jgi:NAD(P)-dependent dehydrogenase (short-subunit alcohol dehydrogenase family)
MAATFFVTGASGFIGKRLVRALLERPDARVYYLMRDMSPERVAALDAFWGEGAKRASPVKGDLLRADLGLSAGDVNKLKGRVDHFFHLAAVYDLVADPELETKTNVEGARNAVRLAKIISAGRFHHTSSISAAGLYEGVFREDMFDEADKLDHPYFASKHEAEKIVRRECEIPWRIYRPGLVVGDSRTGEMDKIDGPYYFFKLIQKMRKMLPPWAPTIGFEGGRLNLVPVDFVVAALVHLAQLEELDGRCFHLTDPRPHRVGDIMNIFARAAHAPSMTLRINVALFDLLPKGFMRGLGALTPVRRIRKAVLKDLGLPDDVLRFVNYPTRFDQREAERLLKPAGIVVPDLENYAWRLWDYWERHLDPDLFIDRSLRGKVAGKVVVVTGGSAGIGKAAAFKLAEAGARTIIVARDKLRLDQACDEAAQRGLALTAYEADIAEPTQCEALIQRVVDDHGGVDILINNAGRSIRRGIEGSYERFHDYERLMQLNYFGCLRLTLGFLPGMAQRRNGHVINISSIGVLTNAPRFSAYVASKAALEAWTRCAASEFLDRGVHFTTINMPLVRTEMVAPTKLYQQVPMLSPDEAADFIVEAIIHQPMRIATRLGVFGQVVHAIAPRIGQIVMNTSFRMFPDSSAAKGGPPGGEKPSTDQIAFTQLMKGMYF